jgi:hypothetical protein
MARPEIPDEIDEMQQAPRAERDEVVTEITIDFYETSDILCWWLHKLIDGCPVSSISHLFAQQTEN